MVGDDQGDISIWNASAGRLFAALAETSLIAHIQANVLSPDGRLLATVRPTGSIRLQRPNLTSLSLGHFERLICGEVRQNLTSAQWAQYAPSQPYQKTCPAYP